MSFTISEFQQINVERALRWHGPDNQWTVLEWAGAMCGEAGEAANVAKKIRRLQQDIPGNKAVDQSLDVLRQKLASEIADTFAYGVLLAASMGINDLESVIREIFNAKSIECGFPERL